MALLNAWLAYGHTKGAFTRCRPLPLTSEERELLRELGARSEDASDFFSRSKALVGGQLGPLLYQFRASQLDHGIVLDTASVCRMLLAAVPLTAD